MVLEQFSNDLHVWLRGDEENDSYVRRRTPVLKLHGSLGWGRELNSERFRRLELSDVLGGKQLPELVLPGIGKQKAPEVLSVLWDQAKSSLVQADQIISIGYRFSQNDITVLKWLASAVRSAKKIPFGFTLVLGPEGKAEDDKLRIQNWLGVVGGLKPASDFDTSRPWPPVKGGSQIFPGWAEDFLLLWPSMKDRK